MQAHSNLPGCRTPFSIRQHRVLSICTRVCIVNEDSVRTPSECEHGVRPHRNVLGVPTGVPCAASLCIIRFVSMWAVAPRAHSVPMWALCDVPQARRAMGASPVPTWSISLALACFLCHVHRFCLRVGSRAASQGVDAGRVALVPVWAIWTASQAALDTCVDAAQFACTVLATDSSHGTLPARRRLASTPEQRLWTRARQGRPWQERNPCTAGIHYR